MKKVVSKVLCALVAGTVFTSTSFLISCGNLQHEDVEKANTETAKSVVDAYVENLFADFSFGNLTSRSSQTEYPAFLYNLDIEDEYGNKVLFEELSENEKEEMADFWKEDYKSELIEKFSDDGELLDYVAAQNQAVKNAKKICEKNPSVLDEMSFDEIMLEELMKILEKNERKAEVMAVSRAVKSRGSSGSGNKKNIDDIEINQSVWKLCKAELQKGYILINSGSDSSSSTLGHASLICIGNGEPLRSNDSLSFDYFTITSFPHDCIEKITWTGQIHGVQYEPYQYWVGIGAARNVKMFAVKKDGYTVKKNKIKITKASSDLLSTEYEKAVVFAESKIGTPYPPYIKGRLVPFEFSKYAYSDQYYYCSSLVRAAFLDAVENLDLDENKGYVAPNDLAISKYTRQVSKWSNY